MTAVKTQQIQRFNTNRNASGLWIVKRGRTILGHIERFHNDAVKTYYAMTNGICVGTSGSKRTAVRQIKNS